MTDIPGFDVVAMTLPQRIDTAVIPLLRMEPFYTAIHHHVRPRALQQFHQYQHSWQKLAISIGVEAFDPLVASLARAGEPTPYGQSAQSIVLRRFRDLSNEGWKRGQLYQHFLPPDLKSLKICLPRLQQVRLDINVLLPTAARIDNSHPVFGRTWASATVPPYAIHVAGEKLSDATRILCMDHYSLEISRPLFAIPDREYTFMADDGGDNAKHIMRDAFRPAAILDSGHSTLTAPSMIKFLVVAHAHGIEVNMVHKFKLQAYDCLCEIEFEGGFSLRDMMLRTTLDGFLYSIPQELSEHDMRGLPPCAKKIGGFDLQASSLRDLAECSMSS